MVPVENRLFFKYRRIRRVDKPYFRKEVRSGWWEGEEPLRSLQEIVAVPPVPSPQAIFCDSGQWEERKNRFVPNIHLMVNQQS